MNQFTIVFLHAFPLHASMWDTQIAALKEGGYSALALDFPGFGRRRSNGQRTMQEFGQSILDQLERKNVNEMVLVGLSMGGYAAFRILERAGSRVRGLVLADTRAGPDDASARTKRLQMAARVETEGPDFLLEEFVPNLLSPGASETLKAQVRALAAHASSSAVYNALAALASRPDSRPMLEDIAVPTMVIVGDEDKVTPRSEAELMSDSITNAQLAVIEGAGHLSNLERPELFNQLLLNFLDRLKQS